MITGKSSLNTLIFLSFNGITDYSRKTKWNSNNTKHVKNILILPLLTVLMVCVDREAGTRVGKIGLVMQRLCFDF
jgi:hypothetical protein